MTKLLSLLALAIVLVPQLASANVAGGGDGQGADVTVVDHHDGTVTLANGIVSIVIDTTKARLDRVIYTHKNSGSARTSDVLLPAAKGRGQYYYGGFSLGSGVFEYALATDPASNGGAYADVKLLSDSEHNGVMEVHFSMLRGSPGFYSTAIMTHRKLDVKFEVGAWGVITRVTPTFNWLSADAARNFFIGQRSTKGVKVPDAPHESTILLDGAQQGQYANKFIYGKDHADLRAWGWSSVGPAGLNVGVWLMTNMEFSDGGPLKRDVSVYPYSELNNSILTGELGMGSDGFFTDGEVWTKTCGPWLYYLNDVPSDITDANRAAHLLYRDALAQAEAEARAWPYAWFIEYIYRVQSVNPTGQSAMSPPSPAMKPSPEQSGNAPPAPANLVVTSSGHHQVALAWTASPGASFYRIWRTTLHADGAGGTYSLGRVLLDDTIAATTYADRSPTDGRDYGYIIEAVNAAGTSASAESLAVRPLPAPPSAAPQSLAGQWSKTRDGQVITLTWSPVAGATGYVIYRSSGPMAVFTWPEHYLTTLVETTYVDKGVTEKSAPVKGLNPTRDYDYQVTAVNAAGISPPAAVHIAANER